MSETRPVRGYRVDPRLLAEQGLGRMQAFVRGTAPPPAIHHLTGLRPTEASAGKSTFALPASGWLDNGAGIISAGAIALVADAPLASAIETVLGPGKIATTSETSINYVTPAFAGEGNLIARASLIDAGGALGFSSAEVVDQFGRLVAFVTSRCVIANARPGDETGPAQVDPAWRDDGTPDPWQTPAQGGIVEDLDGRSGVEALRGWVDGLLPRPAISALMGFLPTSAEEGEVTWRAPASPWWSSPGPFLYGGALACFAEVVHASAFHSVIPEGAMYANLDLKVQFLRPVFPSDAHLTGIGRLVHRGRSVLVANVEVQDAEGRTVLLGTGSAAVLRDGLGLLRSQRPLEPG